MNSFYPVGGRVSAPGGSDTAVGCSDFDLFVKIKIAHAILDRDLNPKIDQNIKHSFIFIFSPCNL